MWQRKMAIAFIGLSAMAILGLSWASSSRSYNIALEEIVDSALSDVSGFALEKGGLKRDEILFLDGTVWAETFDYGSSNTARNFVNYVLPEKSDSFQLVFRLSAADPINTSSSGKYYSYDIKSCGSKYCNFAPQNFSLFEGTGLNPSSRYSLLTDDQIVESGNFVFKKTVQYLVRDEVFVSRVNFSISTAANNVVERYIRSLTQKDPPYYWAPIPIATIVVPSGHSFIHERVD